MSPSSSITPTPSPIDDYLEGTPVGAKEHKNQIIAIVFGIVGGLFVFIAVVGGVVYYFERRVNETIRHERAKERPALKKKATVGTNLTDPTTSEVEEHPELYRNHTTK